MNIDAKIVIQYLRPLFHPYLMLIRWSVKNAKAGMWKSRFPHSRVECPAVQVLLRQEPFPAARPSPVFPEHDILGVRLAPFTYKGCQLIHSNWQPYFFSFFLKI